MKTYRHLVIFTMLILMLSLQSCELAGDIFGAGIWIGVSLVLVVIFVVLWLFNKMRK